LTDTLQLVDPANPLVATSEAPATMVSANSGGFSVAISANIQVTIVADESTNSLLIRAAGVPSVTAGAHLQKVA
jgi:hypothetical protein